MARNSSKQDHEDLPGEEWPGTAANGTRRTLSTAPASNSLGQVTFGQEQQQTDHNDLPVKNGQELQQTEHGGRSARNSSNISIFQLLLVTIYKNKTQILLTDLIINQFLDWDTGPL